MKKAQALELLGGTVTAAARELRISSSAFSQWPEDLTDKLVDRVHAALARKHLSPEQLGEQAVAAPAGETA